MANVDHQRAAWRAGQLEAATAPRRPSAATAVNIRRVVAAVSSINTTNGGVSAGTETPGTETS